MVTNARVAVNICISGFTVLVGVWLNWSLINFFVLLVKDGNNIEKE
jgi:hypothetical protein